MAHRQGAGVRIGGPQRRGSVAGSGVSRSSARGGARHARLQPTLGDGKEPGGFARGKGLVKSEHTAVAAVALRALDRKGGAEAATVGRVCRGRDDVLAHGNGGV